MAAHTINNEAFRRAMEKAGLGDVILVKDTDVFYIASDNAERAEQIASLPSDLIYYPSFNSIPVSQWVEEITELLSQTL